MYGLLGSAGGGGGTKSKMDGSGVVTRKELIYFVSEISRFSRISSRSSIRRARRWVSLAISQIKVIFMNLVKLTRWKTDSEYPPLHCSGNHLLD